MLGRLLAIALALCPTLAFAQSSPLPGFPPGVFQNRAAIDASIVATSIVTPILSAGQSAPSTSVTNYFPLYVNMIASANTTVREIPVAIAGTINNLNVTFASTVSPGTYAVTLRKNGADTLLTCTVSVTTCTFTSSISITAGDTVGLSTVPASTPTASAFTVSMTLTGTVSGESYIGSPVSISGPVNSAATYGGFMDSSGWNATEATVANIVPTPGVLSNLYVVTSAAPGVAHQYTISIFKNGANSGVTCTYSGAGSGAGITQCNDLTDTIAVVAGDKISVEACPGVVTTLVCAPASIATVGVVRFGARFVPTISGEALVFSNTTAAPTASGTRFLNFAGSSSNTASETLGGGIIGVAPVAMTIKKLSVAVSTAPGVGQSRTFTLRKGTGSGQSSQTLTTAISGASQTTNSDTSDTVAASINDFMDWQSVATATNAASTYQKIGTVVTAP